MNDLKNQLANLAILLELTTKFHKNQRYGSKVIVRYTETNKQIDRHYPQRTYIDYLTHM